MEKEGSGLLTGIMKYGIPHFQQSKAPQIVHEWISSVQ